MKLLPKIHKLISTASPNNVTDLTGRPIITAHSWTTSNISRLLGTELDNIILQLKNLFISKNIQFPLIYNSSELIDLLQKQHITDINDFQLTTFDFTSLYTKITFQNTINAIISSCKLLKFSRLHRDFLLNLNNFINKRNYFSVGQDIYRQTTNFDLDKKNEIHYNSCMERRIKMSTISTKFGCELSELL
jgi:hypothetical protein